MANEGVMDLPQEQPMQGAPEGVMSLPQAQPMQDAPAAQKPQFVSSADAYDAAQTAISRIDPQQLAQYKAQMRQAIANLNPTPEQIDSMITLFEYLNQNKDQYKEIIAQAIQDGDLNEGDLPSEYNPTVIGVVLLILHELKDRQRNTMQPPQGMAGGGIADMAQHLQGQGRHGDSILAHINPEEAQLLQQRGGMGSINPYTGLPEFGFFSKLWSGVKEIFKPVTDIAKEIISSPIGKLAATVALTMILGPAAGAATGMLGVGMAATAGIVGGGLTLLGGGNIKDALISGATSYFGAGGGFGGFNPSESIAGYLGSGAPAYLAKGLTAGALGAGAGLLSGQSVGQALQSGLQAGAISAGTAALQGQTSATGGTPPTQTADGSTPSGAPGTTPGVGPVAAIGSAGEMVNAGGATSGALPGSITSVQGRELLYQPGVTQTDAGVISTPDGRVYTPMGTGFELTSPGNAPPPAQSSFANRFASSPYDTTMDYLTRGGKTADMVQQEQLKAGSDALSKLPPNTPAEVQKEVYKKAYDAAGPGMLKTYGPALGIATLGAQLTGATKPYTPNPQPLGEQWGTGSKTGQAYMDANPETFGKWKGWTTPGAAPQAQNPVNTPGAQPLATASPYTIPSNAPSNYLAGSPIPQPYNSPYSVMPTRMYNVGGTVNDPDTSGGNMVPTMTNTFSGGGRAGYAAGGNPPSYPRRNGEISGRGTGTSDSIPAMLSDGEFVLTAKAVRNAGSGSRREGAKRMYKLMHMLERGGKVKGA